MAQHGDQPEQPQMALFPTANPRSHRLVQCRQEIRSAAMISEAVVGVARFTPVAPCGG
jgi:hypothetical protein